MNAAIRLLCRQPSAGTVSGAADLIRRARENDKILIPFIILLYELIQLSKAHQKNYIHLGLGVNDGIRRFKEKWGARPTQPYEMCEIALKKPSIWDAIRAIGEY